MGYNHLLNAILRVHFASSDFNVLNPPAANPVEIDHIFEVQYIVDIVIPIIGLKETVSTCPEPVPYTHYEMSFVPL